MKTPSLPAFLLLACAAFTPLATSAQERIDYSKEFAREPSAVPKYPVPYVVPKPDEVKAALDRIHAHVDSHTSLKVFDNATGRELAAPDPANLIPTAVVDTRFGRLNRWDYTNGVIISAYDRIGEITGDQRYLDYNVRFYDHIFRWQPWFEALENQTGKRNDFTRMRDMAALDHCGAITAALIRTHLRHPDDRYLAWIKRVDDYILNKQFRFADRTLARQRPQPRSLWTDDFYMGVSFLAQMGRLTGDRKYFDDCVQQVVGLSARLFVENKGLYDHGWSENTDGYDPRFYWARANGWAAMAMTELLTVLPADHPGRPAVLRQYRLFLRSIVELQDGTGLWHNLLDHPETYLETSASAMFTYAIARGVNEGWLSPIYGPAAITGWNGVASKILPDGRVDGICEGTTYANDGPYYFQRGAGPNTTFFGSVLYAGAEIIRLLKNPDVQIAAPNPGAVNSALHVKWTKDPAPR